MNNEEPKPESSDQDSQEEIPKSAQCLLDGIHAAFKSKKPEAKAIEDPKKHKAIESEQKEIVVFPSHLTDE